MAWPDTELVTRAARGEHDAIAALLAGIRPGIVRYCRAHLGAVGGAYTTADDVSQDVCIALLRALPRYKHQGVPFSAFVFSIAARKVTDAQRAASRQAAPVAAQPDQRDISPGPEQAAVAAEQARLLIDLLGQLTETQREIIVLRVAVGLTAEEVGNTLKMSAVAVRVAQSRALARLRSLADGALDPEGVTA